MIKDQLVEHFRAEQARIIREREGTEAAKVEIDLRYNNFGSSV